MKGVWQMSKNRAIVVGVLAGTLECASCFGGYITITVEEDGQEHDEAVPCRRCAGDKGT